MIRKAVRLAGATAVLQLIAPNLLHAQSLAGVVTDSLQQPLFSAMVVVAGVGDTLKPRTLRTNLSGRFAITKLAAGDYAVSVRRIGYVGQTVNVTVAEGEPTLLNVILRTTAPTLDTVRARVEHDSCVNSTLDGFLCRRQAGIGFFRDAHELAALKPEQLLDLVRDLPGIRPYPGRAPNGHMEMVPGVRPSRCLKVLVNGRPDISGRRWWTARDVVAIEYYDQWSKIPLDFRQIADNVSCDLMVYWLVTARPGG